MAFPRTFPHVVWNQRSLSSEQRPGLGWKGLGLALGAGLGKATEGEAWPGSHTGGMSSVLKEVGPGRGGAARQLQEPGRSPERTGRPPSLKGTAPAQTMASDNCKKVISGTCGLCFYLFLNGTFLQHQLCRGWGALGLIISLHFYRNSPVLSAPFYR